MANEQNVEPLFEEAQMIEKVDQGIMAELDDMDEEAPEQAQPEPVEAKPADEAQVEPTKPVDAPVEALEGDQVEQIKPPSNLSTQQAEAFKNLAPEAQKFINDYSADTQFKNEENAKLKEYSDWKQTQHVETVQAFDRLENELTQWANYEPQMPDVQLITDDPYEYQEQLATYNAAMDTKNQKLHELENIQRQRAQYNNDQMNLWYEDQQKELVQSIPDMGDPEKAPQLSQDIANYAVARGYSKEQLTQASARDIVTLNHARLYEEAMRVRDTIRGQASQAPKAQQPGGVNTGSEMSEARRRFNENPTEENYDRLTELQL